VVFALTGAKAAQEHHYPVLQIGTQTYHNVTVTTKAKNYIFILHSQGMTNIRVAELSPQLRQELGYEVPHAGPKANSNWIKEAAGWLESPALGRTRAAAPGKAPFALPPLTLHFLLPFLGVALAIHLFLSYCCGLICKKTGNEPGALIWLPILQILPMLRAAGMSGWWLLAWIVPLLNVIASIIWAVKIVEARGKSGWVALFLLLPLTSFFAFLYLAFSNGAPSKREEKKDKQVELMTLEAA
jgi:hypothetical protein